MSAGALSSKRTEAETLMKKAQKAWQPSLLDFRLKPDWEEACPLFEKAALAYRQTGQLDKAIEAYEKAAHSQEKLGSLWHAAKHTETCGAIAKDMGAWPKVVEFHRTAAAMYTEAGRPAEAGDALARAARMVEAQLPGESCELYKEAVALYEGEGKEAQAGDLFRQAVAALIRSQKHAEAVGMLLRFGQASDAAGAHSSQCKAYLGAVVVWLYAENAREAWQVYQDVLAVGAFAGSEEALAADALFSAYATGSADKVKAAVQAKASFRFMDTPVARLAMKLPTGDVAFLGRSVAALMGGQRTPAEDADSDEEVL